MRVKNAKWNKYLEFLSIRTYLSGAINSKSSQIGSNETLEQKVGDVNLTNYLRGIELFLNDYSDNFNDPSEIIDNWKLIRNEDGKIQEFKQEIENYIVWLNKKYSPFTAKNYQSHVRGFLKWNNITIRFRNYTERSEKSKETSRLGITLEELMDFGEKVIGFLNNSEIKLFCRICQSSGLGSSEVLLLKFKDFRSKDFNKENVRFDGVRKKTGALFTNFLIGNNKKEFQEFLKRNSDKEDEDLLFGENIYPNFKRQFNRAYKRCVDSYFPKWKESKKSIFTFHTYRACFISICRKLRVPKHIEDRFVAHQSSGMNIAYTMTGDDLFENYKVIQNEILGTKVSSTEEQITKKIFDSLQELVTNNGKRQSQFRKFNSLKNINKATNSMRMSNFLQIFENSVKQAILNDEEFLKSLRNKL